MDRLINLALKAYAVCAFVFIFLPVLTLIVFSFHLDRYPSLIWKGPGLVWYKEVLNDPAIVEAFKNSLVVALSVGILSTFFGGTAAYFVNRWDFRGKHIYLALTLMPPTTPLIVLGLSLLVFLSLIHLSGTLFSIVFGHVVFCSPFAMALIRLRLTELDRTLEEAAWNLGHGEWRTIARVVLPQLVSAIGAALLITMALSFDEFIVAWFVSALDVTLPVKIYAMMGGNVSTKLNAVGSMVFAISILLVILAQILWMIQPGQRSAFDNGRRLG